MVVTPHVAGGSFQPGRRTSVPRSTAGARRRARTGESTQWIHFWLALVLFRRLFAALAVECVQGASKPGEAVVTERPRVALGPLG